MRKNSLLILVMAIFCLGSFSHAFATACPYECTVFEGLKRLNSKFRVNNRGECEAEHASKKFLIADMFSVQTRMDIQDLENVQFVASSISPSTQGAFLLSLGSLSFQCVNLN